MSAQLLFQKTQKLVHAIFISKPRKYIHTFSPKKRNNKKTSKNFSFQKQNAKMCTQFIFQNPQKYIHTFSPKNAFFKKPRKYVHAIFIPKSAKICQHSPTPKKAKNVNAIFKKNAKICQKDFPQKRKNMVTYFFPPKNTRIW